MEYATFDPEKNLREFVRCYWTLDGPAEENPERQSIVPDGCIEMIFHYGDLYRQFTNDTESIIQPRCFVIGQLTKPLEIQPTGKTGIFSVRFHPDGFTPFTEMPLQTFENTAVNLEDVFGTSGKKISEKILEAQHTEQRIQIIEKFLSQLLTSEENIDRVIKSTIAIILHTKGQLSVDELSDQARVHRRQLERKFATAIGLSPKQLSKTIRLQAAFTMLVNNPDAKLSELAHEGEYYDQAHFIKDFKEMTGLTPKEFYGNNLRLSALFSEKDA